MLRIMDFLVLEGSLNPCSFRLDFPSLTKSRNVVRHTL